MTPVAEHPQRTGQRELDQAVGRLRASAQTWSRLPVSEKAVLADSMRTGAARVAERSVRQACLAKGIPRGSALEGEEWLTGPFVTVRFLRQLVGSLLSIARRGNTMLGPVERGEDGRLSARVYPVTFFDRILLPGARRRLF